MFAMSNSHTGHFSGANLAWELVYAFATTSDAAQTTAFLTWFISDCVLAVTAVTSLYPHNQLTVALKISAVFAFSVAFLLWLTGQFPDDYHQITAYWTGIAIELPIGWLLLYDILHRQNLRGHSLRIW